MMDKSLGKRIRALRELRKLSQERLQRSAELKHLLFLAGRQAACLQIANT